MEKVFTNGRMGENMKVNIKMIKSMDLVAINGQMEENILENGKIVKDMEEEK